MKSRTIETLDLRTVRDPHLLARFYRLYVSAFPIERERERLQVWESLLWGQDAGPPRPKFHLLVVGRFLKHRRQLELYAGLTLEFYRESQCGLIAYLAVRPQYRRQGLARLLINKAFDIFEEDSSEIRSSLRAVFAETHDPRLVKGEEDSVPPIQRLMILDRLGARWIKVPYVEPEVNPGHGRTRNMILLTFPLPDQSRDFISARVVRDFIHEFYRAHGVTHPDADPDVEMMDAHLLVGTMPLQTLQELVT